MKKKITLAQNDIVQGKKQLHNTILCKVIPSDKEGEVSLLIEGLKKDGLGGYIAKELNDDNGDISITNYRKISEGRFMVKNIYAMPPKI